MDELSISSPVPTCSEVIAEWSRAPLDIGSLHSCWQKSTQSAPNGKQRLHFPFPKYSLLLGLALSRKSCLYYFRKIDGFFFLGLPETRQMVSDFHAVSRVASETSSWWFLLLSGILTSMCYFNKCFLKPACMQSTRSWELYQNVLMAHVLCSGARGSQQNYRGDPLSFWGLGVPKQGSTPATPLHMRALGTFLSKQDQRNNHGSLKMEKKSQKSKETICLCRGRCVFYKGEFLELVGDFIFLCPGKKKGHQIGQTGA